MGTCWGQPAAGAVFPLLLPGLPCGGSLHGPVSPLSLPPSAGVYVIRCESLQIPPLCVIWAGRSILPPPARRSNGEPPGLPGIIRNSNRDERDLPSRRKMLQFWRKKTKSMRLNSFFYPSVGLHLFQVLSSLPSVPSVSLLNDSRRNWESEHLCLNGLVAKWPF